jgi:isoleucyl-tRNA synthetase
LYSNFLIVVRGRVFLFLTFKFMDKSKNAQREEETLKFWKENDVFNKSLTKEAPKGNYVFYDGPPFATGLPHYGHILGSTTKDVIGRYQTMRGFRVPRKWGWDTHGLPIENIVEKDLGISGRKAIEEYGVDKFAEHARASVLKYVAEWKKTVDRIGRWVDFDNSYMTMDNSFIESVWWALGQMNDKGLLYEGVRVLAYCPRCETPIANSEIAMDNSYKDITDISVYVKFKINTENLTQNFAALPSLRGLRHGQNSEQDSPCYLLAWTTTPWTLPGNTAIAVNKDIDYVFVKNQKENEEEILILAKDLFEKLKEKFINPEVVGEVKGSDLVGLQYEPVFDYYKNVDMPNKENIWKVWHADFVTADQGTGIAHEAPAFGEDDMNLAKANNIPFIRHVEPNGIFTKEVTDFPNVKAKPKDDPQSTDVLVIKYLAGKGTLFAKEKIIHSYPHCYRCDTPLLYYALPSWFVNIQKVKENLLEKAKTMNWIPEHLKEGRFKNIMENAPDWTISRNRFWASPLPIWKSEPSEGGQAGKLLFVNSLEDLKNKTKKSGNKYFVMRHGQSDHNITNIISYKDQKSSHLTEKGKDEVLESAEKLKSKNITKIISSQFVRTVETAKVVATVLNISDNEIFIDERLQEFNPGVYDGGVWKERDDWAEKQEVYYLASPENGESHLDAKKRFGDFIYETESKYKNENILIVTHGIGIEVLPAVSEGADIQLSSEICMKPYKTAELLDLNFVPLPHNANYELDMHRPYIDAITLVDEEGTEYKRIPEVIDCWFESGSMPFAQDHYPFERPDWKETNFPGGFVAEYIAQTRTWFYYTHVISTILFDQAPFENIVTTGTVLAEDGQKMSKSKNNFPDPWILFDKYGVDALRFYLMSSTLMKGEDVNFSEKTVQEISSKIVGRLENVLAFYELYRDTDLEKQTNNFDTDNVLDKWILARLNELVGEVTENMDKYEMALATKPFELFIEDLSTWYLRRSREALKDGDKGAKQTLYYVLRTTSQLIAPFAPFIAEHVWQKLKLENDAESVHLAEWPKGQVIDSGSEVLTEMQNLRDVVSIGLKERQKSGMPVRQPLTMLKVKSLNLQGEYLEILKDELNVKDVAMDNSIEGEVWLDMNITPELKKEGEYRELLRAVQDMRKKEGLMPSDEVVITLSENAKDLVENFIQDFQKTVGAKDVKFADNDGAEMQIGDLVFKIKIEK